MRKTLLALALLSASFGAYASDTDENSRHPATRKICDFQSTFAGKVVEYKETGLHLSDVYDVAMEYAKDTAPIVFIDKKDVPPDQIETYEYLVTQMESKLGSIYKIYAKAYYRNRMYKNYNKQEYANYAFAECADGFGM